MIKRSFKWVVSHPGTIVLVALCVACVIQGPAVTGVQIGHSLKWLVGTAWHFVSGLAHGLVH